MSHVDNNTLGNILIKHHDKWRGDYYLKDDLSFTLNRDDAGRFYILKPGNTSILNGDRVSIHLGNLTLAVDNADILKILDREHINREISSFIINNSVTGAIIDNTDPITYESPISFITDNNRKMALKYEWGMDLVVSHEQEAFISKAIKYRPRNYPTLINSVYGGTCEAHINSFQFVLEHADIPITQASNAKNATPVKTNQLIIDANKNTKASSNEIFDGYRGAIMILLLMVVLILCVLANR